MNYTNNELNKIEFLLTSDKNIICQRIFNVKDYNPKAKNSIELYDYVKEMCYMISEDLKNKNADYMMENKKMFDSLDYVDETVKDTNGFLLQLKMNEITFHERIFPNLYHPKVRVDIRGYLKGFLDDLTDILSLRKPTTTFLNYSLLTR